MSVINFLKKKSMNNNKKKKNKKLKNKWQQQKRMSAIVISTSPPALDYWEEPMPGSWVWFLGHPGSFSCLFHSQGTMSLMLPRYLAKLPLWSWGVPGERSGLMDKCKPFTTNGADNKEQMPSSWRVSEMDFVCEGPCVFPVIWGWMPFTWNRFWALKKMHTAINKTLVKRGW